MGYGLDRSPFFVVGKNEAVLSPPLDYQYHYTASWYKNLPIIVVYLSLWYK